MPRSIQFSMKMPSDLAETIGTIAEKTGASRSAVAASLMRKGLSSGSGRAIASREDVEAVGRKVSALEESVRSSRGRQADEIGRAVRSAVREAVSDGRDAERDRLARIGAALEAAHGSRIDEAMAAEIGRSAPTSRRGAMTLDELEGWCAG